MVIFHSYGSLPEGSLKGPILRSPILRKPNLRPGFVALEISTSEEVAQIVVGLEAFELSFHPGGDALRSLGARPRSGQKLARCEAQQRSCQGELLWIIIDPDDGNTLEWCGWVVQSCVQSHWTLRKEHSNYTKEDSPKLITGQIFHKQKGSFQQVSNLWCRPDGPQLDFQDHGILNIQPTLTSHV